MLTANSDAKEPAVSEANNHSESAAPHEPGGIPGAAPGGTPEPAPGGQTGGKQAAVLTRGTFLWVGAAIVVLAFVASFLGSSMAQATAAAEPAPTVYVTPEPEAPVDQADVETMIAELMPTGSLVRVGVGAPSVDAGADGDLYIDVSTSNVYLRRDGVWSFVGNLKENAAENLAGEDGTDGAQGATGAQGEPGKPGKPGEPGVAGTQVSIGTSAPDASNGCGVDGDIYLDTVAMEFYTCAAGAWVPQQASSSDATQEAPTPTATPEG